MQLEARKLLTDVLTCCDAIRQYTTGKTFSDYQRERLLRSSTEREFSIIGEALSRLSSQAPEVAARISSLPQIIAFRNRIIHGYDAVDEVIVWQTVLDDLPLLTTEVKAALAEPEH
ncbi:MAG TPA: HepT-like ribonuclease domain-containing protein [Verrucomicrobiae bacterium]|nr:HepT-like ribonuclease domain-containing protein [Verrucomicrobiae bacterium]